MQQIHSGFFWTLCLARRVALAMFTKGLGGLGEKLKAAQAGVAENLGGDVLEAAKKLQARATAVPETLLETRLKHFRSVCRHWQRALEGDENYDPWICPHSKSRSASSARELSERPGVWRKAPR